MRRDAIAILLGLVVASAPLAVGGEDETGLRDRLRALQAAVHKALYTLPTADGVPAANDKGLQLGVFPVSDLVAPRVDHIPPSHRFVDPADEAPIFGGIAEDAPQPYGTAEELAEAIRSAVWPESWEQEGAFLVIAGPKLLIMQTKPVLRDIRRYLDRNLRPRSHACATVEAEVLAVPPALYRSLSRATTLSEAKRHELDQALEARDAQLIFAGRVTGFLGERIVAWHGRQVAVVTGADVEVAKSSRVSDPIVNVVQAGGYVSARTRRAGEGRLRLDLEVRHEELAGIETKETGMTGQLDLPVLDIVEARATLTVPERTWALVGAGKPHAGLVRIVLVRATPLARPGGKR